MEHQAQKERQNGIYVYITRDFISNQKGVIGKRRTSRLCVCVYIYMEYGPMIDVVHLLMKVKLQFIN